MFIERAAALVILLGVAGGSAAGGPAGGGSAAAPADPTSDPAVAILRLEDRREATPLIPFLTSADPTVRARAIVAAGRIGDPMFIPPLGRILSRDPNATVRANAAFALGMLNDTTAAGPIVSVLRGRGERAAGVRARCVEALGKRRVPKTAALCSVALTDSSEEVREAACLAVWQLRAPDAWPALVRIATDASSAPALRWKSCYALMRMVGAPAAGKTPIPGGTNLPPDARARIRTVFSFLMHDRDPLTRIPAVRGLAAFDDSSAAMLLRAALRDPDWRVRVEALRATTLRPDDLRPLFDDPNPNVRLAAFEALGRLGTDAEARRVLRAGAPKLAREREVAARALAARVRENRTAIDSLAASLLGDPGWQLRAAAADVLTSTPEPPDSAGIRLLERIVNDDPRVAKTGIGPLLSMRAGQAKAAARLAAIRSDLERFLEARDSVMRSIALESASAALGDSLPDAVEDEWLSIVRKAWDGARADSANDVALSVVSVLEAHATRPGAAAILNEIATGRDYIARREACRALGAGKAEPVETGLSVEDYEAVLQWAAADHEVTIRTGGGVIRIRLFSRDAPLTCWSFTRLAERGFFDRGTWHRIVPDFVVQDGCPSGDGNGGPGYTIRDELNEHPYATGAVGMALSGRDTGGSQFFITVSPQPHLDGRYTVFGEVVEGMDLVDRLVQYDPIEQIRPAR